MVRLVSFLPVLLAFVGIVGCTSKPVEAVEARVSHVTGTARWREKNSEAWQEVNRGQKVVPGMIVETFKSSRVDLEFTAPETPRKASDFPTHPYQPPDSALNLLPSENNPRSWMPPYLQRGDPVGAALVFPEMFAPSELRIWPNSIVLIDEYRRRESVTGDLIQEQARLEVRAGHVMLKVCRATNDSHFNITFTGGSAQLLPGVYDVTEAGYIRVFGGSATVADSSNAVVARLGWKEEYSFSTGETNAVWMEPTLFFPRHLRWGTSYVR